MRMRVLRSRVVLPLLLTLLAAPIVSAQPAARAHRPPRLTLFISVDSLSSDQLLRMRPKFTGGLAQLLDGGAFFPLVRYEYAETVTAVGHATMSTGANPWRHGLVSNKLLNRETGQLEPVLWDPDHPALGTPLEAKDDVSPRGLQAEGLGDRLRLHTAQKGKVVAVSGKARTSVILGGRLGQAWWFNESVGQFVTGTWYAKAFPEWVARFGEKRPQDAWNGKAWQLLHPAARYDGLDDRANEADYRGLGRVFPHPLGGEGSPDSRYWAALGATPMMGELIVSFARTAIDAESLGRDEVPDALFVGFSHVDKAYHLFGPDSWEAQDTLLRLDRNLAELLRHAERAAGGRQNLLVVLTADHGGAALPEHWASLGLPAARVSEKTLMSGLNAALKERFGAEPVVGIEEVDVYLDPRVLSERKLDARAVREAAAQWLEGQPVVTRAISREALEAADWNDPSLRPLKLGYHRERSGDVLFLLREYHVLTEYPFGTSHGTPYAYDSVVPLVLWGRGVRPGHYPAQVPATDVAPTVSALWGMSPPAQAEGSPRTEALALPAR